MKKAHSCIIWNCIYTCTHIAIKRVQLQHIPSNTFTAVSHFSSWDAAALLCHSQSSKLKSCVLFCSLAKSSLTHPSRCWPLHKIPLGKATAQSVLSLDGVILATIWYTIWRQIHVYHQMLEWDWSGYDKMYWHPGYRLNFMDMIHHQEHLPSRN